MLVDNWVIPHGISTYRLADNGPQFVLKFFTAVAARLGIKHWTTKAYQPKTNGRVETFNRTIVVRL